MLRYRIAFEPDRGHFVLPALTEVVPAEETYASREAAAKVAERRNDRVVNAVSGPQAEDVSSSLLFLEHRESA